MRKSFSWILRSSVFALLGYWSLASATDVTIYDRATRQTLPLYQHHGRMYVAGEPGHEYEIRIRSDTPQRMLAVTTVDGINVITGETAALGQAGYVLDAYAQENIQGWRKSMSHTAAFFFTPVATSYAALTGRADQVGVIGVALFRERLPERDALLPLQESRAERAASDAPAAAAKEQDAADRSAKFELGTGHGASEYSAARYAHFDRASNTPEQTIVIYYDSRRNLIARHVIPREAPQQLHRYANRLPQPFPRSAPGFTPDP